MIPVQPKPQLKRGAWDTPTYPCPHCGEPMDADWVNVEIGMIQCGPFHCFGCVASEIGPEWEKVFDTLSEEEKRTGFYRGRISPLANQRNGIPIGYKEADRLYREEYFQKHGNPYNAKIDRHS